MPAGRGSTSASGAASPSSRSAIAGMSHDLPRRAAAGAEQALAEAGPLAERLEAAGNIDFHRAALPAAAPARRARRARAGLRRRTSCVADGARERRATDRTRRRSRPPHGCCSPRGIDSGQARCWSSSAQVAGHPRRRLLRRSLARARAHRARPPPAGARRPARRTASSRARRSPSTRSRACPRPARRSRRRPRRGRRPVRRGGRALARVRKRPRARLRPPRPGPLPGRPRPTRAEEPLREARELFARWATGPRSPRRRRCLNKRPRWPPERASDQRPRSPHASERIVTKRHKTSREPSQHELRPHQTTRIDTERHDRHEQPPTWGRTRRAPFVVPAGRSSLELCCGALIGEPCCGTHRRLLEAEQRTGGLEL